MRNGIMFNFILKQSLQLVNIIIQKQDLKQIIALYGSTKVHIIKCEAYIKIKNDLKLNNLYRFLNIMKTPVVFVFNIRRSVYENFGTTHFNQIKKRYQNIHLLPIINNLDQSIQQRAIKISKKLPELLRKHNIEQTHLISYSLSGLDSRFALNQLNLSQFCKSLTTISTPHQGSKTANFSQRNFFNRTQIQPVARLLGVGIKPFHEAVPQNIKYFNQQITDVDNFKYFSIGAQRLPNNCNVSLRQIGNYLRVNTRKNFTYQNDGVFGYDQIQWGEHLANFDADHSQIVGISSSLGKIKSFDLALQNIQNIDKQQAQLGK